jgi:tetratricopeptide (TPR) repeat protein
MALKAVRQMLVEVGDERVAAIPQMKETRQRLLDEAVAFYTDLIASNPHHSQAYVERGDVYRRMGDREKARDDYKKAIECDPENADAFCLLGDISRLWDDHETILHCFRRAIELQPTNPGFYGALALYYDRHNRGPKEAAAAYRKVAELLPPGSAGAYIHLAQAYLVVGDHRAERENFEKARSIDPSNPGAYLGLGRVHDALGEYEQALAALTKALDCPRVSSAWLADIYRHRADIYSLQNKHAAAVSEFSRAIEMMPHIWFLYKGRGEHHFHLQHYEQALADFAKALEITPDDLNTLTVIPLEDVVACPDEKFRTGMRALAEKTIQFHKSRPDAPKNAGRHNSLAWVLATWPDVRLRDPGLAVAHAQKAVELAPSGDFWNTLGVAQYRNGEWKAALEALMKSVQLRKGGDSGDFFFLALAHWQLNEKDKARAWYDRAVAWMDKNQPQNGELKRFRAEATALLGLAKAAQTQNKKD